MSEAAREIEFDQEIDDTSGIMPPDGVVRSISRAVTDATAEGQIPSSDVAPPSGAEEDDNKNSAQGDSHEGAEDKVADSSDEHSREKATRSEATAKEDGKRKLPEEEASDMPNAFQLLLRRAKQYPLLTSEEELDLARRIERGDLAAKERLINSNLLLVIHIAKRYQISESSFALMDLIQEGTVGLVRASEKFDYRKGFRFSTYATLWIRQAIGRGLKEKDRTIRLPVHVDDRVRKLERTERELATRSGHTPSDEELTKELEWSTEDLEDIRKIGQKALSLDTPVGEDGETGMGELLKNETSETPEDVVAASDQSERLASVMSELSQRERDVIEHRYMNDLSATETGRKLGMTPRRVRQIEEIALRRMSEQPELQDFRVKKWHETSF